MGKSLVHVPHEAGIHDIVRALVAGSDMAVIVVSSEEEEVLQGLAWTPSGSPLLSRT